MSLAGLLTFSTTTRNCATWSRARSWPDPADTDLVAPPALRPVLAAALARGAGQSGAGGFVLAVTATAREAEDLAAGLGSFLPPDSVA